MVIIALDFENKKEVMKFLSKFNDEKLYVKIGMELFYSEGPAVVKEIKDLGHKIFLDLKLHDIPNTVNKAMKSIAKLGADMVNLHASGGIKMMEAALEGLGGTNTKLIAVTQLTSTSKEMMNDELSIPGEVKDCVIKYALNAKRAGLFGVVCSAHEVEAIKEACGEDFITVTPGIRLLDKSNDDQVRITTPSKAKKIGCDYIVVGRPITASDNPVAQYNIIKGDFM